MPIAKEAGSFEPAPAGTHIGRCYGCVSLGTQHSPMFADSFKVMLLFELPHEPLEMDGKTLCLTVTKEYTLSLGKKANLRKHLDSWRGRPFAATELEGFEVSNVVGAPCQLTIVHAMSGKGSAYAKIEAITGLAKGMTCPPQIHPSIKYEMTDGNSAVFRTLPDWIQNKIRAAEEFKHPTHAGPPDVEPDPEPPAEMGTELDEVPF